MTADVGRLAGVKRAESQFLDRLRPGSPLERPKKKKKRKKNNCDTDTPQSPSGGDEAREKQRERELGRTRPDVNQSDLEKKTNPKKY